MAQTPFSTFAPMLAAINDSIGQDGDGLHLTEVDIRGGEATGLDGLQITGEEVVPTGSGLELTGGAQGTIRGYDRDGGAYIQVNVDASVIAFKVAGGLYGLVTELGLGGTSGSIGFPTATVGALPPAASHTHRVIVVTNEAGGPTLALSDGTNWRRVADNAVVS